MTEKAYNLLKLHNNTWGENVVSLVKTQRVCQSKKLRMFLKVSHPTTASYDSVPKVKGEGEGVKTRNGIGH